MSEQDFNKIIINHTGDKPFVAGEVPPSVNSFEKLLMWAKAVYGYFTGIRRKDNDILIRTEDGRVLETIDPYELDEVLAQRDNLPIGQGLEDDLGWDTPTPKKFKKK